MTTLPEGESARPPPERRPRYQDLRRFRLPAKFRGRSAIAVQLWWLVQATLFRMSPQVCYGWRRFLLRLFGAKIGRDVRLRATVEVTYPWKLEIGEHSWIGDEVVLYTLGPIHIGANSVVSQRSYLCTGSHDPASLAFDIFALPIWIGDECWVAADVFVAPGVSIADGAVIGVRSTVLDDMPAAMVCYGSPAVPVRARQRREDGATPGVPARSELVQRRYEVQ
jgi:putative colanic acid biosynthesis acetyltransferase WcaF